MNAIDGTGAVIPEPNWRMLLSDELEVEAASEYWRVLTTELRERDLLAPANRHAVQRLVLSYLAYDRCSREVAEHGAVTKPKRGNPKAISRLSPHFTAMREAGSDAAALEAELGIAPRRRGGVTKVQRKTRTARASDAYLKRVS